MALILNIQFLPHELHQYIKEHIHIHTPSIIFIAQPLELLLVVRATLIPFHHTIKLALDLAPQLLDLGMLVARREFCPQRVEVNLAQINLTAGIVSWGFSNDISPGCDRGTHKFLYISHHRCDIWLPCEETDSCRESREDTCQCPVHAGRWMGQHRLVELRNVPC